MTSVIDIEVKDFLVEMKLDHNTIHVNINVQKDNQHQEEMQKNEKKEAS